ncbi:MAG: hypothetical protein PHO30_05610 [Candidatus Omnitrophica bacterium]|nr:hypothetical protein [Candidatus Omnitrophota bacterium]
MKFDNKFSRKLYWKSVREYVRFWMILIAFFAGVLLILPLNRDNGTTGFDLLRTNFALGGFKPYIKSYATLVVQANSQSAISDMPEEPAEIIETAAAGNHSRHVFTLKFVDRKGVADYVIDSLYFDLPKRLRATTPDDTDIVVVTRYYKDVVGKYTDGTSAYRRGARVYVADKHSGELIGSTIISGDAPPSVKSHGATGIGSRPDRGIVAYLVKLLEG